MEQNGAKWSSSLLQGLGASSVSVPATKPSSKIKQLATALTLAAVAAMASFAPSVAHAADGPTVAPVELAATYIYSGELEPEPASADEFQSDDAAFAKGEREADNPFNQEYKIPDRDRDFVDTMNDAFNVAQGTVDKNAEVAETMSFFDDPILMTLNAITSPLDTLVNVSTDKGSTANEYAQTAADVTNMAIKYSTAGAGALVTDGIHGVQAGVSKIAEMRDKEHAQAQTAVDAARERMSRIYNAERERMAAESSVSTAPSVADRVDVQRAGGDLETSNEGLDVIFKVEPAKAGKYDHDNGLSR